MTFFAAIDGTVFQKAYAFCSCVIAYFRIIVSYIENTWNATHRLASRHTSSCVVCIWVDWNTKLELEISYGKTTQISISSYAFSYQLHEMKDTRAYARVFVHVCVCMCTNVDLQVKWAFSGNVRGSCFSSVHIGGFWNAHIQLCICNTFTDEEADESYSTFLCT